MSENTFKCVKCGGIMTKGFIADFSEDNNFQSNYPTYWVEGEMVYNKALFGGFMSTLELSGKRKFVVRALRCEGCGFLENYAV